MEVRSDKWIKAFPEAAAKLGEGVLDDRTGMWTFGATTDGVIADLEDSVNERTADDPLLGDRIAAWAAKHGLDKAAKAWEKWTSIPCGCSWRQRVLNRMDETIRKWGSK